MNLIDDQHEFPPLEIEEVQTKESPNRLANGPQNTTPASNTRQQQRICTITQDCVYHLAKAKEPFTSNRLRSLIDWAQPVLDNKTGDLLEYRHLMKHPKYKDVWSKSFSKEIRRLATTTETIAFKTKHEIPTKRHKDITYGCIVCVYQSKKSDPYRPRITMGGNLVNYPDDYRTPTADLLMVKLMPNSVISTVNAKFMTIDLKDFYLMTPMTRYEYFRMKLELFPQDVINKNKLRLKVDSNGNIFCEVKRGMYGLPQAGIIAQDLLTVNQASPQSRVHAK